MTIVQMRYFEAVCNCMSYSKAAELMKVSQPAISAAIRELEKECGVVLLERVNSGIKVTEEGEILLKSITPVLAQYSDLAETVKNLPLGRKCVRVGFSTMFGNAVYPDILALVKQEYPNIETVSIEKSGHDLLRMMENGQLDIIICDKRRDMEAYSEWTIADQNVVFCVQKDHPLAKNVTVTWEEIAEEEFVMFSNNRYGITEQIEKTIHDTGRELKVIHRSDQIYTVERFIESRLAVGFLPETVVKKNSNLVGVPFADVKWNVQLMAYWKNDSHMTKTISQFIGVIQEYSNANKD